MKTTSILALATALALCTPSFVVAQDATAATTAAGSATTTATGAAGAAGSSATGAAGAAVNADTNADGNISADEQAAADAAASTTVTASVDANADGTISVEELTAANAALAAQGGTTVSVDANGDGTISDDELANANTLLAAANVSAGAVAGAETLACAESGIEATISGMGDLDMAALAAATNVSVVSVSDCDSRDVTAALATEGATNVRKGIEANAAAVAAIQARGASVANVLGATTSGETLTVYVADIQG
jgi:hypothetical protein